MPLSLRTSSHNAWLKQLGHDKLTDRSFFRLKQAKELAAANMTPEAAAARMTPEEAKRLSMVRNIGIAVRVDAEDGALGGDRN